MMRRLLRALVRGYQLLFSHWINAGCRYEPSCSHYAIQALDRHGAAAGTYLAARRILRCNPFCLGGHDPVPAQAPRLFSFLTRTSP
jgi:putative membrane protein insertion efficiency factor